MTISTPARRRRCKRCLQQSGVDPRQVAAIAFDSQMAGIGTVDEDFNPATRFDSWLDMRCQPYIRLYRRALRRPGHPADRLPAHLRPRPQDPVVERGTARGLPPHRCALSPRRVMWPGRMAGLKGDEAFMDYTFIHFTGFSDAQDGVWSASCAAAGRGYGQAAAHRRTVAGDWRGAPDGRRRFWPGPGTPIAAGCGDTAANALGAGITRPGMLFDVAAPPPCWPAAPINSSPIPTSARC